MASVARPLTTVDDALERLLICQPKPTSIAVIDSAVRGGIVDAERVRHTIARVPAVFRVSPADLDPVAESGIESLVRVALRDAGLRVASQVVIPGIGRVDFLVESRVIVEVDGREWHRGEQARDYRRDLEALQRGYRVVRVDYEHAVARAQLVVAAVARSTSAVSAPSDGVTFLRSPGNPRADSRGSVGEQALYS
jgi:very-short-patch-repair endonuclease